MEKKDKIICLLMLLALSMGIIFFPKEVHALDFEVEGNTIEVNSLETFRDYIYFKKIKGNYNNFFCTYSGTPFVCGVSEVEGKYIFGQQNPSFPAWYSFYLTSNNNNTNGSDWTGYGWQYQYNGTFIDFTNWQMEVQLGKGYFSTNNIKAINSDDNLIESNFTLNDIECKYETSNCITDEPGGDEPGGDTPTQDEISKDEFYKMGWVGITALCVLIFMLFFKWCFPMKGGRK